jgi:hypothetical protein
MRVIWLNRAPSPTPLHAVGIGIDQIGRIGQQSVDCGDDACNWSMDIGCGLDRFDDRVGLTLDDAAPELRHLDGNQIAQCFLCVISDADLDRAVR